MNHHLPDARHEYCKFRGFVLSDFVPFFTPQAAGKARALLEKHGGKAVVVDMVEADSASVRFAL